MEFPMLDFRSKFFAAVASLAVTAAILVSLGILAERSGVPSWIQAVQRSASVASHPAVPIRTASRAGVQTPATF